MQEVKKVVVVGPESTGKSTLCGQLAKHYTTLWCPEYAREYLLEHGTNYTFDDLLIIAKGQLALEKEYLVKVLNQQQRVDTSAPIDKKNRTSYPLLFLDTDMHVMKVWCEYVFNRCHLFILEKILEQKCDLYLLCNIDLPWVKDELREYPDLKSREELYHNYKDALVNQNVPWADISGGFNERFKRAVHAVDTLFTSS